MSDLDIEGKQQNMVAALAKSGEDVWTSLTAEDCAVWHMTTGIATEAGELLSAVKKVVIYNQPLDLENIKEELGDLEFYLEGLRQAIGVSRTECLLANQAKLSQRYPGFQYSDGLAQARKDKAHEGR